MLSPPGQNGQSYSRLYATDASVYEEVPSNVVFPENAGDCVALVKAVLEQRGSLIARGGGTSIAGQCVGAGTVIDFSRYMAHIQSAPEDNAIWVQPGVVLDDLNDYLRSFGLQFPVDISTSSRCTIGGMVGNNAAGSHSFVYGSTRENVLEVDAVLADGSVARFGSLDSQALHAKRQLRGLEGGIYRAVFDSIDRHRNTIVSAFPDVSVIRRNTGYALDVLAQARPWVEDGESFNLAKLICGSEGTLALVTAIHLKLSPLVGGKALACIHFDSLESALQANTRLLVQDGLASCELIDSHILLAAADHPSQRANRNWVIGEPAAVLVAEFFADTPAQARVKAERAVDILKAEALGIAWPVLDGAEAPRVWNLRKAGLGLLMGLRQRARPVAVIEDSAVPVLALPDFARDIGRMMEHFGIACVYYGHASVGLLHLRPSLDLDVESDRIIFLRIAEQTAALVKQYRGSLSGEHGDGRLRAPYLRNFLGNEVYALLEKIKIAFDPAGMLNPGKIISEQSADVGMRQRPHAAAQNFPSGFDWKAEGGFDLVLERCNGSGNCRQRARRGAMCPTFQATDEELYSTRGRANLLRQAFSSPGKAGLDDKVLVEAMDSCLSCKACKSECPSGVDMAQMKAEYLYRRGSRFWQFKRLLVIGQPVFLAFFSALPTALRMYFGRLVRQGLIMRLAGLEREPPMPSPITLRQSVRLAEKAEEVVNYRGERRTVLLVVDPYVNQLDPKIGEAAIFVLKRLGYFPELYFMDCSLRLITSKGYLDEARSGLLRLRDSLIARGTMPIVGLEPAELLMLRDEAVALLGDEWPTDLISRCFLLDEFLLSEPKNGLLKTSINGNNRTVYIHPHCHERALGGVSATQKLLETLFDFRAEVISTGCCGMGGEFGYLHREISKKIFRNNVRSEIVEKYPSIVLVSATSCRHQFHEFASYKTMHLAEFLRDMLVKGDGSDIHEIMDSVGCSRDNAAG